MKNILVLILTLSSILSSCERHNTVSQEQEQENLDKLYLEIQILANSEQCIDSENWTFTAIGAKACGGPIGYIAYSLSIDVSSFLNKVEDYTKAQDRYNKKWGIISDCSVPEMPIGIECINEKTHFIYQN